MPKNERVKETSKAAAPVRKRVARKAAATSIDRKHSRPRRQEVIDVAASIFRRKGFAATTTQDLGDALGILKGSIYYYIDSKDDLLFAIIQEQHEQIYESLAVARADEGPMADRLARLVRRNVELNIANQDKAAVFYTEFHFLSPERQKAVIGLRDDYEHFVRELLAEGQKTGDICADLDVRVATSAMLTMLNSLFRWYRPRGGASEAVVVSNITSMAVNSVQCGRLCSHAKGRRRTTAAR
jgi:AcrR family transcriptional regulator